MWIQFHIIIEFTGKEIRNSRRGKIEHVGAYAHDHRDRWGRGEICKYGGHGLERNKGKVGRH